MYCFEKVTSAKSLNSYEIPSYSAYHQGLNCLQIIHTFASIMQKVQIDNWYIETFINRTHYNKKIKSCHCKRQMPPIAHWRIVLTFDLEWWPWPWYVLHSKCAASWNPYGPCHAKYEVYTCIISKVMANVKVGHKQTNRAKTICTQIYLGA